MGRMRLLGYVMGLDDGIPAKRVLLAASHPSPWTVTALCLGLCMLRMLALDTSCGLGN